MKLVLVRHGKPDEDHAERPHDPPLNAQGQAQSQAVARLLEREGITRVVASPLQRAHQTALPLARQLGLPVHTVDGWAEADRDAPRYRSGETLRALGDAEWQRFLADPVRYVGGDPVRFRADVLGALEEAVERATPDDRVAVFTHGLVINVVLSHLLGLARIVHFQPGYASITRLAARGAGRRVLHDGGIGIISVNESGHHAEPAHPTP